MRTNISREMQKDIVADSKLGTNASQKVYSLTKRNCRKKYILHVFLSSYHDTYFFKTYSGIEHNFCLQKTLLDYWAYEKGKWDKPWYNEGQTR